MDWDDFKFVQAVARSGSVRGAGELLRVHGSTVARHLDALERRVGTKLFSRTSRGMELTAAGAEVIEVLDRVAEELEQVERRLQSQGPGLAGVVALALPATVAGELVIPVLDSFHSAHPEIELTLLTGPALAHLESGAADMALWVTDEPPEHLIGRPLGAVMAAVYGTAEYLAALEPEADPQPARWVGPSDPASLSEKLRCRHYRAVPLGLRVQDPLLVGRALQLGQGLGVLPCFAGDALPELRRAPVEPVRQAEAWLFTRPEARGMARIQAVSAFLQQQFADHQARLTGLPTGRLTGKHG